MNPTSEPQVVQSIPAAASQWTGHVADDTGATYGPEPMASLSATDRELVLTSSRGTYRIARPAVARIGRGGLYPWFFRSLRIHHSVPGYPKELQFKPLGAQPKEIVQALRLLGYPAG